MFFSVLERYYITSLSFPCAASIPPRLQSKFYINVKILRQGFRWTNVRGVVVFLVLGRALLMLVLIYPLLIVMKLADYVSCQQLKSEHMINT